MKIEAVFIVLTLLALPLFTSGAKVDRFQGGNAEAVAELSGPGFSAVVNITMPAECYVLNATVNVTGVEANGAYPVGPEVALNGTVLWAFNGTGYGALGKQDLFSDGKTQVKVPFGVGGGTGSTAIRLPKGAVVQNATLEVNVSGPREGLTELVDFTGAEGDQLGLSVSNAGDVNNDGYDDVIVGALPNNATGCAYIYFGGQVMDNTPDVILTGANQNNFFGTSVSTAGDVNEDGYDDVIVGAPYNDTHGFATGAAYIYFGGPAMDNIPDVILMGAATEDQFGYSVSNAGDVNNDGYDDVIVGATGNDAGGRYSGRAYVYFGGPAMDSTPDVLFTGAAAYEYLGTSVSTAGDVNKDGYDDVIVSEYIVMNYTGRAYIYFGGPAMDNVSDLNLTGAAAGDAFGISVSNVGDVNKDGYDYVIVGAYGNDSGGTDAGCAYIFLGGPAMDNIPDMILDGDAAHDYFGESVSNAGDVNKDGYDDVIVGAAHVLNQTGRAYIYYGGPAMDNVSDLNLTGAAAEDLFGFSVSTSGDMNKDGYDDVIVGAPDNASGGDYAGRASVYSYSVGLLGSNVSVGSNLVWNKMDCINGTYMISGFSSAVNEYLRFAFLSGNDSNGNSYVDVPINISAGSEGNITLLNLSVVYQYNATVPDFAGPLNKYISAHKDEKDAKGNITVPLMARSESAGKLRLYGLNITYDGAPMLVEPIPDLAMDEDTSNNNLLDLYQYFQDEYDSDSALEFSVENATNSSIVSVSISSGSFLSADALAGDANDNWTGVVSLRIRCTDSRGFSVVSNSFDLVIRNVNDSPVITSTPPINATVGAGYEYQLLAVDGDNDALVFSLPQKPDNMTISTGGEIRWIPSQTGPYNVSAAVGDGHATVYQNFSIHVTGNNIPMFTSIPVASAIVGVPYIYNVSAVDKDEDTLTFSLATKPEGMNIDPTTGRINWTPTALQIGIQNITLKVTDGLGGEANQTFIVNVISPARPKCVITSPLNGTKVSGRITIKGTAAKGEASIVSVQCRVDGGTWVVAINMSNWKYQVDTTGLTNGPHTFEARAFDGGNYSDPASVTLVVDNPKPYISSGNGLWWILPSTVLVMAAAAGVLFWKARKAK